MYRHLLVPLDGTPLSAFNTEQALSLAASLGARVTLLHVQPDFGSSGDGALLHSLSPALFRDCAAGNSHAVIARAEAAARAAKVACEAHIVVGARPAEAILEAARQHGCDLVVLASHGRRGLSQVWLGSVTRRLLQQTTLPVLVSSVESNRVMSDEARALAIIRAEHRSLGAVIHGLRQAWGLARQAGREPDYPLLKAMLYYIAEFPERQHHPKEDAYLFRKLRQRTAELDPLIAHLQAQHERGGALFGQLRRSLAEAQSGVAGAAQRFEQALDDFAQAQWRHMGDEEQLILPAASRYLSPADWAEIAGAFGENGDPRFGAEQDEAFEQLFSRVLRLAAEAAD